jgi:glycosyltransferase involved in cell wall biosynthesis
MPRVSILLPFHNVKTAELKKAIASAIKHRLADWELVLVGNANPKGDEAAVFARAVAYYGKNIRIFSEPEKGIAHALNTGLGHCTGEYIARMDADDEMLHSRLEAQSRFLSMNPEIGLVSGLVDFRSELHDHCGYEEYVRQINSWITEEDIYHHRFVESPFAHPSVMFRRELVDRFGGYSTAPIPEDYELWLRWMHNGVRMAKIDHVVLRWNDHASRLSRTHPNYKPEAFDTVRYHYLARWLESRLASLPPVYLWGGKLARKKAKLLEEQGVKISGYIDVKQPKPGDEFMHYMDIPAPGKIFIISMVSNRGKYAEVRDFLLKKGYEFERDFVLAG